MKRAAKRFIRVVPARLRKSEKRLKCRHIVAESSREKRWKKRRRRRKKEEEKEKEKGYFDTRRWQNTRRRFKARQVRQSCHKD
jgi:hypothetical protein